MATFDKRKTHETILTMTIGFVALYLIFSAKWLIWIAFGLGISGIFFPTLAQGISRLWMKFAEGLGFVNSRILLSLIFFLFLFPISLLFRLFNKDALHLRKPGNGSAYSDRSHTYGKGDFEKMW
jgi:uncharacterized membrane protein